MNKRIRIIQECVTLRGRLRLGTEVTLSVSEADGLIRAKLAEPVIQPPPPPPEEGPAGSEAPEVPEVEEAVADHTPAEQATSRSPRPRRSR